MVSVMRVRWRTARLPLILLGTAGCGTVYSVRMQAPSLTEPAFIGSEARVTALGGDSVAVLIPVVSPDPELSVGLACLSFSRGKAVEDFVLRSQRTPRGRYVLALRLPSEDVPRLAGSSFLVARRTAEAMDGFNCFRDARDDSVQRYRFALDSVAQGRALGVGLGAAILLIAAGAGISQ
jgi:hypothetical protein